MCLFFARPGGSSTHRLSSQASTNSGVPTAAEPPLVTCTCSDVPPPPDTAGLARYLTLYNTRRPHFSLADQTPDEAYFTPLSLSNAA